jgi:uncharacterized protein (TIGR02596 family)
MERNSAITFPNICEADLSMKKRHLPLSGELVMTDPGRRGFTLIELLVVIVVIALLMALAIPNMLGAITGVRMTSNGEQIAGLLSSAQQIASSEGRTLELRLYKHEDFEQPGATGVQQFRTFVLFRYYEIGEPSPDPAPNERGRPLGAPLAVIVGDQLTLASSLAITSNTAGSTLLTLPVTPAGRGIRTAKIAAGALSNYEFKDEDAEYISIKIKPNSTSLTSGAKWCLTLVDAADEEAGKGPTDWKNFFCVQIDPINARITSYRPGF